MPSYGKEETLPLAFEDLPTDPEFVKAEKNLTALGFFTPSSKTIREEKAKVVRFSRVVDGQRTEASVTIVPAALYGLPVTADQDKYLALQKLIHDRRRGNEEIRNPIGFTTAELLRLLGRQVRAGKNYDEIAEWMRRMTATTIVSEGTVFLAGRNTWASDTFHVFERAVSFGKELPDGTVADRNYVWLSDWQLENINHSHLLPVDFDTYKQLKNHIAKVLVPLLQIWLYASAREGVFEKRYDELCQHLSIQQYAYPSQMRQTLAPALDELVSHGYLAAWRIEAAADRQGYKLVVEHGPKYYQDRRIRGGQKAGTRRRTKTADRPLPELAAGKPPDTEDPQALAARALVTQFYALRYGQPQEATEREAAQAAQMLAQGEERARHLVEFAAQQGKEANAFPNDFGGVSKLMARAAAQFQKASRKREQADVKKARQSHQESFCRAYRAFLGQWLTHDFEAALPDVFAAFHTEEKRQCAFHRGRAAKSTLSAELSAGFDEPASRASRLLAFLERHPHSGIPTFWEWDTQHNPDRFSEI